MNPTHMPNRSVSTFRMQHGACAAVCSAIVLLATGAAEGQVPAGQAAMAEAAYNDAKKDLAAGNYAAACPKFEESQRLDPALGTQFYIADCYEKTGRPASAWSLFVTTATSARSAGRKETADPAQARAEALKPKLPKIKIMVPDAIASLRGITIQHNGVSIGKPLWGTEIPVDLGEQIVKVSADGKKEWESRVTVRVLGEMAEVQVGTLEDAPVPETPVAASNKPAPARAISIPPAKGAAPSQAEGSSTRRTATLVAGSVGLAGVVVGSVLGGMTISTWKEAKTAATAPETRCRDTEDFKGCPQEVKDIQTKASSFATGSNIGFIVGGAALAGAAILWFAWPSNNVPKAARVQLIPAVGAEGAVGLVKGIF